MLVSFIGSPCSGKTTLAAQLFTALKVKGIPCELLLEQARRFIAERRFQEKIPPTTGLILEDTEQHEIMSQQVSWERILRYAVGDDVVVVTDSSPFNTLLYISDLDHWYVKNMAQMASKDRRPSDLTFYCAPVPCFGNDPNRIHDEEQSRLIDKQIEPVLTRFAPAVLKSMIPLNGDYEDRYHVLHSHVTTNLVLK